MLGLAATLLLTSSRPLDRGQALYNSFERKLAAVPSVMVTLDNGTIYRFMGRRYRLDSPKLTIICDAKRIYRNEDGKVTITKADDRWADEVMIRGFEGIEHGVQPLKCTYADKVMFGGAEATRLQVHFESSPEGDLVLYFSPKTNLLMGTEYSWQGRLEDTFHFSKIVFNAHLKAKDFSIPAK